MEWRKTKQIGDVSKFDHGSILFVEQGIHGANFDSYKWKREFDNETEKITLSFNDFRSDPEGITFSVKISIARTETARKLKEMVARRMELSINEFYLVRNSNDTEIKEMHKSMTALGLSTHSMIKIVLGTPSDSSQYKVKMFEVKLTDEATDKGNQIYTASQVGTLNVKPEDTGFVLK